MSSTAFSNHDVYNYNNFLGLISTRESIAYFLAKRFYGLDVNNKDDAIQHIDPDNVVLGSGCASLLNSLFYTLAEEGDAVLIPAPYYAAFESDMKAIAKCVPFPVELKNPVYGPSKEDLENASLLAKQKGYNVKILLLTNPNNPLGVIYDSEVVENCIIWARQNNIHTIVDEIYALSVQNTSRIFPSVIRVLKNKFHDDVHMVWALSKDFCSSGFRVGVLYTQNKTLISALSNLNVFSGVSHPIQMVLAELLTDDSFIDSFLHESRILLKRSYNTCIEKLDEMGIPYVQAAAGIFIYCDFSAILPEPTFENEKVFSEYLDRYARVVLTPGACQRENKAGMFRLCYAWVSHEVLHIALERIQKLLVKINDYGFVSIGTMNDDEIMNSVLSI